MKTEITKDSLTAFGMAPVVGDPGVSMEKVLGEGEGGKLSLQVTHYRNIPEIVLSMPDGALIYLTVGSIENLQIFTDCIRSYEPNY